LKAGAEFLWTEYNREEVPSALGTFTLSPGYTSRTASNDNTGNSLATFLLGCRSRAIARSGPAASPAGSPTSRPTSRTTGA
jgi:hypothetical protein